MNKCMSILGGVASLSTTLFSGEEFHAHRDDYAAKAVVVESLQTLFVKRIEVKDVSIGEFLSVLNQALQLDSQAVVNFVVRMPRIEGGEKEVLKDEDMKPWQPKTVSFKAEQIDFASAVDRACQQAGFQWLIEIDRNTRIVTLVIAPDLDNR